MMEKVKKPATGGRVRSRTGKTRTKVDNIKSMYSGNVSKARYDASLDFGEMEENELRETLRELYKDSLIAQAVNLPVIDSMVSGREIKDPKLKKAATDLALDKIIREAGIKARTYGKCGILPVLIDGEGKKIPFSKDLETVETGFSVKRLLIIDEFEEDDNKITDIFSESFGKPKHYKIGKSRIHPSRMTVIHANRSGISFIESVFRYFCDFESRNSDVTKAVYENNFIILYTDINLLHEVAAANIAATGGGRGGVNMVSDEAYDLLNARVAELRENANSDNGYGLDKENEKIETLLRDNIDQLIKSVESALTILASAVNIPASIYLNQNSTSALSTNNDYLVYSQVLTGLRDFMFSESLTYLDKLIGGTVGATNMTYEWNKFVFELVTEDNKIESD